MEWTISSFAAIKVDSKKAKAVEYHLVNSRAGLARMLWSKEVFIGVDLIDRMFFDIVSDPTIKDPLLVTCEAKQYGERILEDQIREQVVQAFATTKKVADAGRIDAVLPIVVKVVKYKVPEVGVTRGVYVAEFDAMDRASFEKRFSENLHDMPLTIMSRAFYYFQPAVRGISDNTNIVSAPVRDEEEE